MEPPQGRFRPKEFDGVEGVFIKFNSGFSAPNQKIGDNVGGARLVVCHPEAFLDD